MRIITRSGEIFFSKKEFHNKVLARDKNEFVVYTSLENFFEP